MPSHRHRWIRFTTRSLLLVIALIAAWCGYHANQAYLHRRAVSLVAELGGATWAQQSVSISSWSERYKDAVRRVFGDVRPVVAVDLSGLSISERDLEQLRSLEDLEWISIANAEIKDDSFRYFRQFKKLRWLDVSGSDVSIEGVKYCAHLRSLEWLDVTDTRVTHADLDEIQSTFPNATIGFTSAPTPTIVSEHQELFQGVQTSAIRSLWTSLHEAPYSASALEEYLTAIAREREIDFPNWYISAVYRARRQSMEPFLVIEVYNGTRGVSFNLGCLLVFSPDGELLRSIGKERVHWSLRGPTTQFDWSESQSNRIRAELQMMSNKGIVDLIDLNGDGFDEIPTQRWDNVIGGVNVRGESTSIYTTKMSDIPCLFCVGFSNRGLGNALVDLAGIHPTLAYRDLPCRELFLQTPCYSATPTGTSILAKLPQRVLARFIWSDEAQTFLGPTEGPPDTWLVIRKQSVSITKE